MKNIGIIAILVLISVLLVITSSLDVKAVTNEIKVTAQVKGTEQYLGQTWGLTLTLNEKEGGRVDQVAEEFTVKKINNLVVSMPIPEGLDLTKHYLNVNAGSHLTDLGVTERIDNITKNINVKLDLADAI